MATAAGPATATPLSTAQRALRLSIVAAVTLPVALLVLLAWAMQRDAVHKAREQARSVVAVSTSHVSRVVEANTIITREIRNRLARLPDAARPEARQELHEQLKSLVQGMPQINSVWVLDAAGYPLASSLFAAPPRINYADREYFVFHQSQRDRVFVSRLLRTRSTQELFFDISARWEDAAGNFRGVINVTLRPEYFIDFYREVVGRSAAMSVLLKRDDGYVLARWPGPPEVGERIAAGGAATTWLEQPVPGFPLAVRVTLDRQELLRRWGQDVASLAAVVVAVTLLLVGALAVALRRTQRELAALQRLAQETDRRGRAEDAQRQARKLEALGQLTGSVAHDFNNLLGVIQNNLFVLVHQQPALADSPRMAGAMRAVQSGTHLTRTLLAFSRRQALRPQRLDLAQALPQAAELLRVTLGGSVPLDVDVAPGTPSVEVDPAEFELALLNLAVNARAAIGGSGTASLAARPAQPAELPPELALAEAAGAAPAAGGYVAIAFSDSGAGMTPEVLERAFEPFFTTKPEGQGTGLGLSQVWGLCKQAGGSVALRSAPGQGTTVTLFLPAAAPATSAAEPAAARPRAEPLRAHVLLVDDNAELAGATAALLEALGARVSLAAGADAAQRLLAAGADVDIVVSDIVMPGGADGIALALALQELRPGLPVLLLTGHAVKLPLARAAGLAVLHKPVDPAALESAIREALAARAAAH